MTYTQSFISKSHTATTDTKFSLVSTNLWIRSGNIHVETNAAKYGDLNSQEPRINAGDVVFFDDFNLYDIVFKNATAGSNTTVRFAGVVMTNARKKELGIPLDD